LHKVGRGGFGVVFAAHDPVLGRVVALKIPRHEVVALPALVDRLLQEARAAANLNHPNIVQVHEAGFIGLTCHGVSEFCDGSNLSRRLKATGQPMDPTAAVKLVALLADAVDHAHRLGILHQDVKPSKVLPAGSLVRGADPPHALLGYVPKLTDFGRRSARPRGRSRLRAIFARRPHPSGRVQGGLFRLWNVAAQQEISTRQTPLGEILRAEFTADQKYLSILGKEADSQHVRILARQALGTGEEPVEIGLAATNAAP
jgi:serine/threonine protein kinase